MHTDFRAGPSLGSKQQGIRRSSPAGSNRSLLSHCFHYDPERIPQLLMSHPSFMHKSVCFAPHLLLVACVSVASCGSSNAPNAESGLGTMISTRIADELLSHPDTMDRVEGIAGVGILTTPGDNTTDSGDLPGLLMAPPCEVSFTIPEQLGLEDGELYLKLAAGVDATVFAVLDGVPSAKNGAKPKPESTPRASFGFEVKRGEEVLFQTQIDSIKGEDRRERGWRRPLASSLELAPGRIACSAGDEMTLRTWQISGPVADPKQMPAGWKIGFGDLKLERDLSVARELATEEHPNVIMIVQDTLRYDRTSLSGYKLDTTPHLANLAAKGTTFDSAYSTSSWTWPSTASLLTGLLPEVHGVRNRNTSYLASGNETIAEVLQKRGYSTGAFIRNPLIIREKNFNQGFESFDDLHNFEKSASVLPKVTDWLEERKDSRFFLYLHLVDSHGPLEALPGQVERLGFPPLDEPFNDARVNKIRRKRIKAESFDESLLPEQYPSAEFISTASDRYDTCVASGDTYLGEIQGWIDAAGLTGKTVFAFTSDHGEEWLDHGMVAHAQSLYSELVHVPLVLSGPGIPVGEVVSVPISNRRLPGTLAHIGGADLGEEVGSLGMSAYDLDERPTGPVFTSSDYGWWNGRNEVSVFGIRVGDEVMHYCPLGAPFGVSRKDRTKEGEWRLYDLSEDPDERNDLSEQRPERAEELRLILLDSMNERMLQSAKVGAALNVEAGAAMMELLGRIGYLDD